MFFNNIRNKFKSGDFLLPAILLAVFIIIGIIVFLYRGKPHYIFLFSGIGFMVALCESIRITFPKNRQIFRRITQAIVSGILFFVISLYIKVNFQFSEIIFDAFALIVTGALIQFIIARIIMPFFLGNAFCSWACWDGAVFELVQSSIPKSKKIKKRSILIAFFYIVFIIIFAGVVSIYGNPALNENTRWRWIIGENIFILSTGVALSFVWGSRAYCRMLCPFITISGLISRYSIFKIKPVKAEDCINCRKCNRACPMLIDVSSYVKNGQRINNRSCIVCERCVSSCERGCIRFAPGLPWR